MVVAFRTTNPLHSSLAKNYKKSTMDKSAPGGSAIWKHIVCSRWGLRSEFSSCQQESRRRTESLRPSTVQRTNGIRFSGLFYGPPIYPRFISRIPRMGVCWAMCFLLLSTIMLWPRAPVNGILSSTQIV